MIAPQDIILLYGISLQFGMQMVALLKHKLNEFCMHDGLENGRQQVGQDDYVEAIVMREEQGYIGKVGEGNLEHSEETLDHSGCLVECMNVNDMKMQPFILHGLTGYAIHAMHDVSTYVGIVFLLKDNFHLHVVHR